MTDPIVTRNELHFRRIDMRGYARSDGLYEVEGRVVDRKPEAFTSWLDGRDVPANAPIHDMGVRIIYDKTMKVHAVETFTDATPYAICPGGGAALQTLVGLSMTKGWSREVRERLSGAVSCTHLMQLLMPLATVAFQSMGALRRSSVLERDATGRPLKVDSCYAYGAGQELVKKHWPEFYEPAPETKG